MFKNFTTKLGIGFVAISLFLTSCVKNPPPTSEAVSTFDKKVALAWNELYLEVEQNAAGKVRPPQSGRILGYIGLAEYEALVQGMPNHNSLANRYQGLSMPAIEAGQIYHFPAVYSTLYAELLKDFFATETNDKIIDAQNIFKIYNLENSFHNQFIKEGIPNDVIERSETYAKKVADAFYAWSATDNVGHEFYKKISDPTYVPPSGAGKWQPSSTGAAMGPYWGKCRLMAATDSDRNTGVPPLPYSTDPKSKFYQQAQEVYVSVNDIVAGKDPGGRWLAEFWGDDMAGVTFTPAGRLLAITNQLVERDNINLEKCVEMYAKLGMGLNDAGVCCWSLKYKWNVLRPETYINQTIDKNWKPIMGDFLTTNGQGFTPPFPAYPSGHSTFGAVGAEVIQSVFGSNINFTDNCHIERKDFNGTPRLLYTVADLAWEDAYSRIPLGVHFRMDCDEGVRVGYLVGRRVNSLPWKK